MGIQHTITTLCVQQCKLARLGLKALFGCFGRVDMSSVDRFNVDNRLLALMRDLSPEKEAVETPAPAIAAPQASQAAVAVDVDQHLPAPEPHTYGELHPRSVHY